MTALSTERLIDKLTDYLKSFTEGVGAAEILYKGGMVSRTSAGYLVAGGSAGAQEVCGVAWQTVDNSTGANAAKDCYCECGVYTFANGSSSITIADLYNLCYCVDDQTVTRLGSGGYKAAGIVVGVDSTGVQVLISSYTRVLANAGSGGVAGAQSAVVMARGASTTNIASLAAASTTVDGITYVDGERILLKNQTATEQNGLYAWSGIAAGTGVLTRTVDADGNDEVIPGMIVAVSEGTLAGDKNYQLTTNATIVVGTTSLTFAQLPDRTEISTADTSLTTRVSTEESTRSDADASLTTRVSTEESTRSDGDASLTTRVSTAEASLTTRVSTEESTRSDGDASLTTRVSTEESARSDGDASLTTRVSTEESTRSDGDASLTTRVSTEESTRSDADASLTTRISTEESLNLANATVRFSVYDFREVDSNGDVANLAGHGGILASDSTPALQGGSSESQELSWVTGNVDIVAAQRVLPAPLDDTQDATLNLWVSSGAAGPNPASFTVETSWDLGAVVSDAASDGAPGAAMHMISATIAAADIPAGARLLTIMLTPNAHAADPIQLYGAELVYARA